MIHIRPHRVFDLVLRAVSSRIAHVKIPHRTENWLLETFCLIAAGRIVSAQRIFEFGTFRGATTLNLALNFPGSEIVTFDLDPNLADTVSQDKYHADITRQHFAQESMEFDQCEHAAKIVRIENNSLTFDSSRYHGLMDLVFVDGGHDMETLEADTRNAFLMATGCIAWHDYGNSEYPDVKEYLDDRAEPIFHVEESRMCLWFAKQDIQERLSR